MIDPLPTPNTYSWGLSGDIPFVGNFFDESATGDEDEIGIFRPSTKTFWIVNIRTGESRVHLMSVNHGNVIRVGNFMGDTTGHQQIAQFDAATGNWHILNADTGVIPTSSPLNLGFAGGIPVPGEYLPPSSGAPQCTQLGVWKSADQKFYIADGVSACGSRSSNMIWGSNNDLNATYTAADDIPLSIRNASGISMPGSYRPDKGVFPASVAAGQWWIHDAF